MWRVIVNAKVGSGQSGAGTLSRESEFDHEPTAEELKKLRLAAREEHMEVYHSLGGRVAVDLTVRKL